MKLSREIKTGIIVIGGIVLFILGFGYLKSSPIFDNNKTFYAVYTHVGGLQPGTVVSINGFNVGKVKDIRFKDAQGNLLVTFSVSNDFEFSKNSIAELYDTGIIGGKGIQIRPVFDTAPLAASGDTLITSIKPGITELVQQKLTPLQLKVEDAVANADSLLINVNEILDNDAKQNLRETISGLNTLVASFQGSASALNTLLAQNQSRLDSSVANVAVITANVATLTDSLNNAGLAETLSALDGTVKNLDVLLSRIASGEGSIGKLMKDEKMYDNLNKASRELNLLLQDFRLNPKRYVNVSVFGKKQKEYELPENDPAQQLNN